MTIEGESSLEPDREITGGEPRNPEDFDIFTLSPERRAKLSEAIAASKGLAIVAIHPLWEVYNLAPGFRDRNLMDHPYFRIARVLKRLIHREGQTPPAFVFESQDYIDQTLDSLEFDTAPEGRVVLVSTLNNLSVPMFQDDGECNPEKLDIDSVKKFLQYSTPRWSKLVAELKELGVRKIILGGQRLIIAGSAYEMKIKKGLFRTERYTQAYANQRKSKRAGSVNYTLLECVGQAALELSRDFDVEISNFTEPESRHNIKERENPDATEFDAMGSDD